MSSKKEYPRWKHHPSKDSVIVNSEKEEKALGKSYCDSPNDFPSKQEEKLPAMPARVEQANEQLSEEAPPEEQVPFDSEPSGEEQAHQEQEPEEAE